MIERRKTRGVMAGSVAIGGGAPITVQSMTNTDTRDVAATLRQIRALEDAGYTVALIDTMSAYSSDDGADAYIETQRANAQAIADAFRNSNPE